MDGGRRIRQNYGEHQAGCEAWTRMRSAVGMEPGTGNVLAVNGEPGGCFKTLVRGRACGEQRERMAIGNTVMCRAARRVGRVAWVGWSSQKAQCKMERATPAANMCTLRLL